MFGSIITSSAFSGLASISSYLLLILLARADSPEVFAAFSYAVVCGLVLVLIVDCAADQCGSHFMLSSGVSDVDAFLSIYLLKALMICVVIAGIVAMNVSGISVAVPYESLVFIVPAFSLGPLFELRSKNLRFAAIVAVERIVLLIICAAYVKTVGFDFGVYLAYFAVSCGSLIIQFRLIGPMKPSRAVWRRDSAVEYAIRYWPVYLSLFAQATYGHVSRLIIEGRRGLLVFAAVSLALQTLNVVSIAQSQVDRHFRPAINRMTEALDAQGLKTLLLRYLYWYVIPLCVVAGLVANFAEQIVLLLFGPNWTSAAEPLRTMAPLIVTVPLLRFVEMVVVALRIARLGMTISVLMALLLLGALSTMPIDRSLAEWLFVIVALQALHVTVIGACVVSILRRRVPGPES